MNKNKQINNSILNLVYGYMKMIIFTLFDETHNIQIKISLVNTYHNIFKKKIDAEKPTQESQQLENQKLPFIICECLQRAICICQGII
jgi:hypothetical protein